MSGDEERRDRAAERPATTPETRREIRRAQAARARFERELQAFQEELRLLTTRAHEGDARGDRPC